MDGRSDDLDLGAQATDQVRRSTSSHDVPVASK